MICDFCIGSGWKMARVKPILFVRCWLCDGAGTVFAYFGYHPHPQGKGLIDG